MFRKRLAGQQPCARRNISAVLVQRYLNIKVEAARTQAFSRPKNRQEVVSAKLFSFLLSL